MSNRNGARGSSNPSSFASTAHRFRSHPVQSKKRGRGRLNAAQAASLTAELEASMSRAEIATEEERTGDAAQQREICCDLAFQIYGYPSPEVASALYETGMAYYDHSDLDNAGRCLKEALSLFSTLRLQDVELLGNIYVGLGNCLLQREQWEPALTMYKRCAEILEDSFGPRYQGLVTIFTNIGLVYFNREEYQDSLQWLSRALRLSETVLGTDKLECADILHNIASIHHKQGNLATACRVYSKTLDIRTRVLGEDSLATVATMSNLAQVYEEQEKWERAFELHSRVRVVRETKLDGMDPALAITYFHLGIVYAAVGRRTNAIKLLQRAQAIRRHVYGESDSRTREIGIVANDVLSD